MRKLLLLAILIVGQFTILNGQNLPPASMADVNFSLVSWERGQVLVRFADQLSPSLNTTKSQTKITPVDQVLADYQGIKLEQLFPVQKPIPGGDKGFTTYTGKYYEYPKLTNIYKLTIKDTTYGAVFPLITALENLGDDYVVYAEPNYHFESDVTVPPADALYQYQYNASSMNADSAWQIMNDSSITDEDIIISIIDTGVDTAHVDLHGKKHVNLIEQNGQAGVDDDGNGYVDDFSGWDFVNMDNGPIDDNSHGTHCAAIAVANHDTIGIAGIAPNAKYLPMKGLESSGGSTSSVLSQCVTYSANNGADILSMSFGGYGRSFVMENALSYAYAFSMPVGAAGNDGICIRNDGQLCPDGTPPAPMYPGAYTFVLAVQATQQNNGWSGYRAWFTNYDFDGPTYTDYGDDFNYEVYAPGLGIISAIPGNQYATWNGTSMACPAVAGAMAVYQAFRPNRTKEQTFVDFISSWYDLSKTFDKGQGWSTDFQSMDLVQALYPDPMPLLWLDEFTVIDTANGDGDFKLDAGENVQVRVDIKNVGTEADSVFVGIRMAQYEDNTIIDYVDSNSYIGSISSYAIVSNNTAMFELDVDAGVVNGRNINFNIYCWTPGGDTTSQDFVVEAQSGCEYNGIFSGTTVWTPDCGIIVTGNSAFDTLVIMPGTEIQIDPGVGIAFNHIQAVGKPDSMIVFTKNQNSYGTWQELRNAGSNTATLEYCIIEYGGRSGSTWGGSLLAPEGKISLNHCVVRYCRSYYGTGWNIITLKSDAYVKNSVFTNSFSNLAIVGIEDDNWTGTFENNVVHDNRYQQYYGEQPFLTFRTSNDLSRITNNSLFRQNFSGTGSRNVGYVLGVRDGNGGGHGLSTYVGNYLDSNYFGFSNSLSISQNIFDFQEESSYPAVDGSTNALQRPKAEAHGHVWKIIVDDTLDININDNPIHKILGLGTHKAAVYFNRPMDVTRNPFVTYGVRDPWTQNIVGDSTSWSADSTIWTGHFDITQLTASDGYNTLSVRHAYDNESFISPIEDYRFQFRINVAGVLSTGFSAVGDTSEIRLSWSAPDSIIDLIGYNILRVDTSQNNHDTNIVNNSLVLDTNYIDDNVIGGNYYLYYYEPVRSSFTESQRSIGVWATPYSSKPRVKTLKAQETSNGSIQFNAGIDANFIETEARFLYGTNPSNLNAATSWQSIGSNYYEVPHARSISSVTAGTVYYYQAQAKNSRGLETGKVDSILTMSTPALTISGATQICSGDSISLAVQSVTPDTTISLTWKYNGGIIGQGVSLKHLPSGQGTYSIELHAEGTYTSPTVESFSVSITGVINNIAVTTTGSSQLCQGETVSLSIPSGYSDILWNTGDTTSTISANQTGGYSATMKTAVAGCTVTSATVNIVVNPLPVATVSTSSGSFDFCEGSSLTLEAPLGASGYQWYKDGTVISGAVSSTLSASSSGSYAVEVTSSDGCSALSASQTVVKNLNPTASISNATALSFCDGGSVVLSAPSGMSYAWSTGATSQTVTQSSSGQVGLTITDANGCTSAASPVTVNVYSVPAMTVTSASSTSICQGESVTLQAGGGFSSYAWSNGATNQNLIATTAGSYSVTGTTSDGCTATSAAQTVTVNTVPSATITNAGSSVLCSGGSATLSAPSGMSSYLWSDGSTSQSITTSTAGNYTVTVTNAGGCSATSTAAAITTSSITTPSISSSGSTTLCSGSNVTLSVPTGYSSYLWSNGATTSATSVSASGNYSVTLTNADGCSTTTSATAVTVNTPPTATIISTGTGAICAGASETLSATSGMSSYQWYANGTAITGATSATYTANASGNYSVSVVDANGCSDISTSYSITNAAAPVATITNAGSSVLCSGGSATLSAPSGMSSYLWSDGSTSQSITTSTAGNYTVTVTNAGGCSATSPTTVISTSQITAPTVTSNGALEFCDGGVVSLAVPTGYISFMWNNGSNFSQITATTSGDYYAQVMNADGCTAYSDTVTVEVFPTPPTPSISYTANDTLMTSSEVTGNQWYFNGNMMPGETGQTLRPLNLGNYSVRLVDTNGCEGDMSAMQFYNSIGFEEALANQIRLFPNPTSGAVTLELGAVKVASVRIYDARGRLLESISSCPSNCRLELGSFEDGMYQLVVHTEEGITITKPVVLQK
ncbi:S8 family serine peptidase [Schleiferiaceae bacterium]|nr:S8 family serine peptidase [Schleiferiaceae bacterium]